MRQTLFAALVWTVLVLAVVFFMPGLVNTPGCMSHIEPSPDCLAEAAAQNDLIWRARTLPLIVLTAGGYALIALLTVRRRRS